MLGQAWCVSEEGDTFADGTTILPASSRMALARCMFNIIRTMTGPGSVLGLALLAPWAGSFGQNLLPNPSFELLDSCPQWPDVLDYQAGARPQSWYSVADSPDYFHACSDSGTTVPTTMFGFQQAWDGVAYSGGYGFIGPFPEAREMIGARLAEPLTTGTTYYASMYVNATTTLGIDRIGMLFSVDSFHLDYFQGYTLRDFAHLFATAAVTDTVGWTLVSGSFVADSAYRYVIVANHFSDALTTTVGSGVAAYLFVDQVCVSSDPGDCAPWTNVPENAGLPVRIFPSPARDLLQVRWGHGPSTIMIRDLLGRPVWHGQGPYADGTSVDVSGIPNGTYLVSLAGIGRSWTVPFVILH